MDPEKQHDPCHAARGEKGQKARLPRQDASPFPRERDNFAALPGHAERNGVDSRMLRIGPASSLLLVFGCSGPSEYAGPLLRFDGDADHARVGVVPADHPLALAGSTFTISAWFLQEGGGDPYPRIVDKSDERLGHNGWALAAHGASGQIHLYAHDGVRGGDFVTTRGAYATGRWHHVAAVARVDRYEIWIDGKRDDGAFFEEGVHALPARADGELRIGTWNHADAREFRGHLGEIAVFRRDLSPAEIGAIARASGRLDLREDRGAYRGAADLVGYWHMAVQEGGRIPDLSPSGADAQFVRTGEEEYR